VLYSFISVTPGQILITADALNISHLADFDWSRFALEQVSENDKYL
jgi:hypothetical protein